MRTTQWARAAELFAVLIELEPKERLRKMDAACAGDPDLRTAVLRLLVRAEDDSTDVSLDASLQQALSDWTAHIDVADGESIGPWRVLRRLGAGGMGQVYLAERDVDDGRQKVALKIPLQRPGRQFAERFRRERGILAGLAHPAIARLVDSGSLTDGRPWFAMEYVDGIPITEYCDQKKLAVAARIQLFLSVLPAVQHAHEQLVLHRDIKPGNVLVDAQGFPRLLDFGIAKSVDSLSLHAATLDEARFFSLASAAPEQISGDATGVTTDVYALGVLLYELVCGLPPLELQNMAPGQALNAIAEQVPTTPSQALQRLSADADTLQSILANRGAVSIPALQRQLRGDLELILARALRKVARARYTSVDAFARDLRALLSSRPIAQRHADRWYRLGRFLRRHRVAVTSVTLVLMFSTGYLLLAVRQAQALAVARDRAEAGRAQAEQVTEFVIGLFRNADPTFARGENLNAQQMLRRGTQALDSELQNQPTLRAKLMRTVADIYLALNDFPNAKRYAEQALALHADAAETDVDEQNAARIQLARVALAQADYSQALGLTEQVLSGRSLALDSSEQDLEVFGLRAIAWSGEARIGPALELHAALVGVLQQRFGRQDTRTQSAKRAWSLTLASAGFSDQSRALAKQLVDADASGVVSNDPASRDRSCEAARLLRQQGALDEAREMATLCLRTSIAIYGTEHAETAAAYTLLASIADQQADYAAAADGLQKSLEIMARIYEPNHPRIAATNFNLGLLEIFSRKDSTAALPYLRKAVAIAEGSLSEDHPNLALYHLTLGQALRDVGAFGEARDALQLARKSFALVAAPKGRNLASAEGELACLDLTQGKRSAAASAQLLKAITTLRPEYPADHPRLRRLTDCRR